MHPWEIALLLIAAVLFVVLIVRRCGRRPQGGMIVSDTSVITNLANIGQLRLLRILYGRVVVPPRVWTEIRRITPRNRGIVAIRLAWWLHRATIWRPDLVDQLLATESRLDRGEAEAIILAEELQAGLILIDEAQGRRVARERGLIVRGLLGILLEAKQRRRIRAVRPMIDTLREIHGFRISDELYRSVLHQAGE